MLEPGTTVERRLDRRAGASVPARAREGRMRERDRRAARHRRRRAGSPPGRQRDRRFPVGDQPSGSRSRSISSPTRAARTSSRSRPGPGAVVRLVHDPDGEPPRRHRCGSLDAGGAGAAHDGGWTRSRRPDSARRGRCFERALTIAQQVRGPDDALVGMLVFELAGNALEARDDARAQSLYQARDCAVSTTLWGAEHPYPAMARSRLALLQQRAGQGPKAEALLRQATEVIERTLGTDHPWFARLPDDAGESACGCRRSRDGGGDRTTRAGHPGKDRRHHEREVCRAAEQPGRRLSPAGGLHACAGILRARARGHRAAGRHGELSRQHRLPEPRHRRARAKGLCEGRRVRHPRAVHPRTDRGGRSSGHRAAPEQPGQRRSARPGTTRRRSRPTSAPCASGRRRAAPISRAR